MDLRRTDVADRPLSVAGLISACATSAAPSRRLGPCGTTRRGRSTLTSPTHQLHLRDIQRVIRAFEEEKVRSKLPGYVPSYDDFEQEEFLAEAREEGAQTPASSAQIQAPEQPRGPHKPPSRQPFTPDRPKSEGFGAGILE